MKDFPPNPGFRHRLSRLSLCVAVALLVVGAPWLRSQTLVKHEVRSGLKAAASAAGAKNAAIKSIRIVQEKEGPAVEILSTKPLVPSIQAITGPDRLVIDLPNARLETPENRINVQADQIKALRANQFQENPAVARVVVDLLVPRAYTWDVAGNRLIVHLGKNPGEVSSSPFEPPPVSATPSPQPVIAAVRAAGPLALVGNEAGAGSTITAGPDTAILRLSSGGDVLVCPGTTVSVTPSQNRHNLMLSMNTGALEAHLGLDASSDSVMTPDFRILLVGPGEFHFAISADNKGNTCVRALPGNTASAMVTELFGDRTYQVKATDQLVFRSGHLDRMDMAVPLECGCPPPRNATLVATSNLPEQSPSPTPSGTPASLNANPAPVAETVHAEIAPSTGVPAAAPSGGSVARNEIQVQIAAPLVFRGTDPPPAPVEDVRSLPLDSRPQTEPALAAPLPPTASATPAGTRTAAHPPKRGFFRRLGSFFSGLFH